MYKEHNEVHLLVLYIYIYIYIYILYLINAWKMGHIKKCFRLTRIFIMSGFVLVINQLNAQNIVL